jgi:hypothetical protein
VFAYFPKIFSKSNYNRFSTLGSTTVPSRRRTTKNICFIGPLTVSEKQTEPKWDRRCPKFLSLQCADQFVVEDRHEVCGDFCRFLFRYGVGRVLITGLKDVLQRTAILGSASYRNNSTDMAGIVSKRVIRIAAM